MDNLLTSIQQKQSRIILAYDKNNYEKLINLISLLHSDLIGVKIHSEILIMSEQENKELYQHCQRYNLFLWEDRKFNDIAHTFQAQIKKYENTRDYISVVPTSGPDILQVKSNLKYFVLVEMSSRNNLFNNISKQIYEMVEKELKNDNNIAGIICQSTDYFSKDMITIKPGINVNTLKDNMGQTYTNINDLIEKPTLIVVGRGLTNVEDPLVEIKKYKY